MYCLNIRCQGLSIKQLLCDSMSCAFHFNPQTWISSLMCYCMYSVHYLLLNVLAPRAVKCAKWYLQCQLPNVFTVLTLSVFIGLLKFEFTVPAANCVYIVCF